MSSSVELYVCWPAASPESCRLSLKGKRLFRDIFVKVLFTNEEKMWWKNSYLLKLRSQFYLAKSQRNPFALPSRNALDFASGTALGQCARVSYTRGGTSGAASTFISKFSPGCFPINTNVNRGFLYLMVTTGVWCSTRVLLSIVPSK